MRVSTNQYHITVNASLQDANAQLEKLMSQMATGLRMTLPSDDPIANVRLSRLEREEATLAQYRDNIGALRSRLSSNESLLSSFNNDLLQARDLLVWAADGANTSADLNAMANGLVALRDSLFYTANSRDQEGRYMFSGTLSNTQTIAYDPTAAAGSRYTWQGNEEAQLVAVGNDVRQAANVTLKEAADLLNSMDAALDQISTVGATANNPAVRAAVGAALDGTDVALNAVSTKIGRLGGAQNIVATLDDNHRNVSLANQQAIIDFGNLDYSEAAVRLNGLTSAIQATQKAYGKVSQLSLFEVL